MTVSKPLDWIKTVDAALVELDEAPQFGLLEPFPVEKLENALQELFESPSLKCGWKARGWTSAEEAMQIGADVLPLAITWAPLEMPICFTLSEHDLKEIMAELLKGDRRAAYFFDMQLVDAFYRYFATEILFQLTEHQFAPSLSPRLADESAEVYESYKQMTSFVIDISLSLNEKTYWGKVQLSQEFRSAWKAFFASEHPLLSEELQRTINVELALEIGYCRLALEEWKTVKLGDLVILDHCSYNPEEGRGGFVLTLNQKPLFRGRFKEGGVKLMDYPLYQEASTTMEEEFDSEEEDLYGDLDDDEDSEFDEDEDEVEEDEEEEDEDEVPEDEIEEKPTSFKQVTEEKPSISPEKLPINLTVEAGRVRMTVEELMHLAPGNLIDLRVFPEQGVDLVVNGKKVGRGELIRMGEMLGVRILSLS